MAFPEFFQTPMGRKYYEHDLPTNNKVMKELTSAINRLCDVMEGQNNVLDQLIPDDYLVELSPNYTGKWFCYSNTRDAYACYFDSKIDAIKFLLVPENLENDSLWEDLEEI